MWETVVVLVFVAGGVYLWRKDAYKRKKEIEHGVVRRERKEKDAP